MASAPAFSRPRPNERRRLSDEDDGTREPESKKPRLQVPLVTDPVYLWAMAPSPKAISNLEENFSLQNLRAAQDSLALFGWMLDGHAPQGQLDRWTRLFLLYQEIYSYHKLPTAESPVDITSLSEAGKMILFGTEDELTCTESGLYKQLLTKEKLDLDKLRLLAKASSTIRFYRACLGALQFKEPRFTAEINPERVRRAIEQIADKLDHKTNDDYRRDLWSLYLGLGELCVYAQITCSKFSKNIDVGAIVRRLPERSTLKISDKFQPGSPEQEIADLWAFDTWLKKTCAKNPGFISGNVVTWRMHCREDSVSQLLAESTGLRLKPPMILMLGHGAWAVVDNKQKSWCVFDSPVKAIACFLVYTHTHHGSCFSNSIPLPDLPNE
jgi:hypothetical protein